MRPAARARIKRIKQIMGEGADTGPLRAMRARVRGLGVTRWLRHKHHGDRYGIVRGLIAGRGRNVLDVGCGPPCETMADGAFLRSLGYGRGVDAEARSIPFPFVQGDVEAIPFRSGAFDAVTCIEVIEHVHHPHAALDELARVVRDDGVVVLTTPDNHLVFQAIWFLWERLGGGIWAHTHVYSLNKRGWLRLLREHGRFTVTFLKRYWGINLIMRLEKKN